MKRTLTFGLAAAVLIWGGCAAPPNVGAFSEATNALTVVVGSVGIQIEDDLGGRAETSSDQAQAAEWKALQTRFNQAWSHRELAMEAVAEYSAGLVAVVESGNAGEANAREVLEGAETLIGSFASAYQAGDSVVELLNEAIVKGYGAFARDRAAHSVAEAIEYVTPAIEDLSNILAQDLLTLERLLDDLHAGELNALQAKYQLNETRDLAALNSILEARMAARDAAAAEDDPEKLPALIDAAAHWDGVYKRELESPWHRQMQDERTAILERHRGRIALVRDASATVRAWGVAHAKLARASREGSTPNFSVLIQLSTELLDTYAEVRRDD